MGFSTVLVKLLSFILFNYNTSLKSTSIEKHDSSFLNIIFKLTVVLLLK